MTQAELETQNWLGLLSADELAKAVAYTQGNHWILVAKLAVTLFACALIARSGLLSRIVDGLNATKARPNLSALSAAFVFLLALAVMALPFTAFVDWHRERAFELSEQPFADWAVQWTLLSGLTALAGALIVAGIYWLVRRTGKNWWVWASGLTAAALFAVTFLAPVVLQPLLNTYTPAPQGEVLTAVTELADAAGIEAASIHLYDGSRQSERFTANVSGLFGTARIALSDTMFQQGADLAEIRAVVAHEIGHFVKHHVMVTLVVYSALAGVALYSTDRMYRSIPWERAGLSVARIDHPGSLPILYALFTVVLLLATPLTSSYSRLLESAADRYALELSNEPDGLAQALMRTANYRAPSPHWLEEVFFFSHPSIERRIGRAMAWKFKDHD
ncbi:M48 family metalloprotease [Primorskyibacter sp. S187A]|uniref:M48 family metalloprotease n=1 Tax=Primorskyibacter sp. S187A TaxID=3415130 RepID=UPI003C7D1297